jgi:CheY-like chemotaxis protein
MCMLESALQRTVLIVEYDPWDRWFATHLLAAQDFHVLTASNGVSALRLAQEHACDAILIDLALPELQGPEMLQQLRATAETRDVPVIVLGTHSMHADCDAEGWLSKPLDELRVMTEVGRVLFGRVVV